MNAFAKAALLFFAALNVCSMAALGEEPVLAVSVVNSLAGVTTAAGVTPVSNIARVELKISLFTKGNSAMTPVGLVSINPATPAASASSLNISAYDVNSGSLTPLKVKVVGTETITEGNSAVFSVEILEGDDVRTSKIQGYLDRLKAQGQASGSATSEQLTALTARNEQIVPAFKTLYFENSIGRFRISVVYSSAQQTGWLGKLQSPDLTIDVLNKGSFFDGI